MISEKIQSFKNKQVSTENNGLIGTELSPVRHNTETAYVGRKETEPNRCDTEVAVMAHKYRKGYD